MALKQVSRKRLEAAIINQLSNFCNIASKKSCNNSITFKMLQIFSWKFL